MLERLHLIYFSPTQTSAKVVKAIARGVGIGDVSTLDVTHETMSAQELPASSLAIIAVPVYGGKVAPLALERLMALRGNHTPAVLVVVYGNRAYEQALIELDAFVASRGFKVIAGATFIGEHSYSTCVNPIAEGRPDASDLSFAENFGSLVRKKIDSAEIPDDLYSVDVRKIQRPAQPLWPMFRFLWKVIRLRRRGLPLPRVPMVDESLCRHCGACSSVCPSGAIAVNDECRTDVDKCIKCCACVKVCTSHARSFDTPFANLLSSCFRHPKKPQILL